MKARLPSLKPAEVIRILERHGFRLLWATKHRTYTDDANPPHLVRVPPLGVWWETAFKQ